MVMFHHKPKRGIFTGTGFTLSVGIVGGLANPIEVSHKKILHLV
jgi:hypothetical protein